jgi:hypothetical protein
LSAAFWAAGRLRGRTKQQNVSAHTIVLQMKKEATAEQMQHTQMNEAELNSCGRLN